MIGRRRVQIWNPVLQIWRQVFVREHQLLTNIGRLTRYGYTLHVRARERV